MRRWIVLMLGAGGVACEPASSLRFEMDNLPPFNDAQATVLSASIAPTRIDVALNNDAFREPERMAIGFDVVQGDASPFALAEGDAVDVIGSLSEFEESAENTYWRLVHEGTALFEGGLIVRTGRMTGVDIQAVFSLGTDGRAVVRTDSGIRAIAVGEPTIVTRNALRMRAVVVENRDDSMRGYAYAIE